MKTPQQLREESGLKAEVISKRLGITRASLWNKENHRTKLTTLEGEKLAEIYNIPLDTIRNSFFC